ncbi:uncharacterized protein M421DRAFT_419424 [Didymella exigua CBS 183.55]|uniref:DUF7707 domain-containing protein n=1 Tax=Didymella exigua CBS 183.55 TaxID=1150837 RepID=A0A6A5RR41_9PLEO|nr:uncharacterized protein M421DRAFT_419424 [Didymella exigua CBS 183.55]KAF1929638.1 hypothetical protein M421DRAFT_419424 [Didymella exigua CBS 183.55]
MLYSSVIVAAALAGFAAAQNNTVIPCCSVSVSTVPEDKRQSWCDAQENTCVDLCGGQGDIASNGNTCDASTLDYSCKCSNGTTIAADVMKTYQQTVPAQMCYYWYDACINATIGANGEGNAAQQFQCNQARDTECGNTTIDESSSGSSSASASSSGASRTSGGASATGASSTGSSTAAASSGAAVALGTPALAAGLLAIFGLAL